MIKIHLSKIMGEKRITQAELIRRTGIRAETVGDLYHELAERISFENLDLICEALNCKVTDLIEYIPNYKNDGAFAKRAKELRIANGLTVRELAMKIGRTQQMISGVESGKREPSVELIRDYAKYFHVPYKWLIGTEK